MYVHIYIHLYKNEKLLNLLRCSVVFGGLHFYAAGEIGCRSKDISLLLDHVNFSSSQRPLS